jgi:hypothetical protein
MVFKREPERRRTSISRSQSGQNLSSLWSSTGTGGQLQQSNRFTPINPFGTETMKQNGTFAPASRLERRNSLTSSYGIRRHSSEQQPLEWQTSIDVEQQKRIMDQIMLQKQPTQPLQQADNHGRQRSVSRSKASIARHGLGATCSSTSRTDLITFDDEPLRHGNFATSSSKVNFVDHESDSARQSRPRRDDNNGPTSAQRRRNQSLTAAVAVVAAYDDPTPSRRSQSRTRLPSRKKSSIVDRFLGNPTKNIIDFETTTSEDESGLPDLMSFPSEIITRPAFPSREDASAVNGGDKTTSSSSTNPTPPRRKSHSYAISSSSRSSKKVDAKKPVVAAAEQVHQTRSKSFVDQYLNQTPQQKNGNSRPSRKTTSRLIGESSVSNLSNIQDEISSLLQHATAPPPPRAYYDYNPRPSTMADDQSDRYLGGASRASYVAMASTLLSASPPRCVMHGLWSTFGYTRFWVYALFGSHPHR